MLLISSCKKDDDNDNNDPTAITKENLSANYKIVSGIGKVAIIGQIDIMNNDQLFPACQRDDIVTLKEDFTYATTDAGVACTPSTTEEGVWALPNTSTIIIDGETFSILSFNGTELKIGYKEEDTPFGPADVELTFRKQ